MTFLYRVDPEAVAENNESSPEILAWKNNQLEVLVEMNKFKELKSCIMESDLGREVQRREEREWRKKMEELVVLSNRRDSAKVEGETEREWSAKMEEKQDWMVATLNQLVSLNTRNSGKAEDGTDHNLFNLLLSVSAAFLFGFFACYLLLTTNLH